MNKLFLQHSRIAVSETVCDDWGDMTDLPKLRRILFESSYGEGSFIQTELWLPDNWNGIFIGLGNGGMAGSINRREIASYAMRGYATAQTDMGTSRGRAAGVGNPDMWADFGWRATHDMAEVSKKIIRAHYGRDAEYAYFIGASTGGQQAFSEAQRFPQDFDGVIGGVPANNRVFLHTYFLWNHNHLRKPDGTVMFTPEEVQSITQNAAAYFQSIGDGEEGDAFVTMPYRNENTVADFLSFLRKAVPHLRDEQLAALQAVYEGPKNPVTGQQIYNGMPISSEIYSCGLLGCQGVESPHYYPFIWTFGENYDPYSFDFDKDLEKVSATLSEDLNANDPDLTAFAASGGKFIAYSGSADPCVPFPDAMKYAERVAEFFGGYEKSSPFFRYFLMPGRDHGGSGLGTNTLYSDGHTYLLETMRRWREQDIAPDSLIAAKISQGETLFERTIYPYLSPENPKAPFPPSCDDAYLK